MAKTASLKRLTAAGTLVVFLVQSLAPSPLSAQPISPSEVPLRPLPFELEIPSELGTVETLHSGTGPVIFHIQEAHGNAEGQKKIEAILDYLNRRYGVDLILLEGDATRLKPELLNFIPENPQSNSKILERLVDLGVISGPEVFLFKHRRAAGVGIEGATLYRANALAFYEVLKGKKETNARLRKWETSLASLAARDLSKKLRDFLKQEENFESEILSFEAWLDDLGKKSKEILRLNFADPRRQFDWPNLVRFFTVRKLEREIDHETLEKEKKDFLAAVRRGAIHGAQKGALREGAINRAPTSNGLFPQLESLLNETALRETSKDIGTEPLIESLVEALPRSFNYAAYPNLNRFIGTRLLSQEIDSEELFEEMEQLRALILRRLISSPRERKVVSAIRRYRLIKKLLSLELTPREYGLIVGARLIAPLQLFAKPLEFYRIAKERDRVMLANIEKRLKETGKTKAVLITGGFHTKPFEHYFKNNSYSYALITPKLENPREGRDNYLRSSLHYFAPVKKSTLRLADFSVGEEALLNLGLNPASRNQIIQREMLLAHRSELRGVETKEKNKARSTTEGQRIEASFAALSKMHRPSKILFVMPMYREMKRLEPRSSENPVGEDALRVKVSEFEALRAANPLFQWRILAVDDGTPDGASAAEIEKIWLEILEEYRRRGILLDPEQVRTVVVTPEEKARTGSRKGYAVVKAMKQALAEGWAEFIGYTDTDISTNVKQTPLLWDALTNGGADAAIGSRWLAGGEAGVTLKSRFFSSKLFNLFIKVLLPPLRSIVDTQRGFKLFTRDTLRIILEHARDPGMSFDTELLLLTRLAGGRVQEVPIAWFDSSEASTVHLGEEAKRMAAGVLKYQFPRVFDIALRLRLTRERKNLIPDHTRTQYRSEMRQDPFDLGVLEDEIQAAARETNMGAALVGSMAYMRSLERTDGDVVLVSKLDPALAVRQFIRTITPRFGRYGIQIQSKDEDLTRPHPTHLYEVQVKFPDGQSKRWDIFSYDTWRDHAESILGYLRDYLPIRKTMTDYSDPQFKLYFKAEYFIGDQEIHAKAISDSRLLTPADFSKKYEPRLAALKTLLAATPEEELLQRILSRTLRSDYRSELREKKSSTKLKSSTMRKTSQEKKREARITRAVKRQSRALEKEFASRYGVLPAAHPITRYITDLFHTTMGPEYGDYQILVLPGWQEINAVALAHHRILVPLGLLRFVHYEEELKAVLAHEAIHIKRRHHQDIYQQLDAIEESGDEDDENPIQNYLAVSGLKRIQETEANLRWVVEEMKQKKINPLGEVIFLERLKDLEEKHFGRGRLDITHGNLEDQSLNTRSLFYFLDLPSLSHELHSIPDTVRNHFETVYREHLSHAPVPIGVQKLSAPSSPVPLAEVAEEEIDRADGEGVVELEPEEWDKEGQGIEAADTDEDDLIEEIAEDIERERKHMLPENSDLDDESEVPSSFKTRSKNKATPEGKIAARILSSIPGLPFNAQDYSGLSKDMMKLFQNQSAPEIVSRMLSLWNRVMTLSEASDHEGSEFDMLHGYILYRLFLYHAPRLSGYRKLSPPEKSVFLLALFLTLFTGENDARRETQLAMLTSPENKLVLSLRYRKEQQEGADLFDPFREARFKTEQGTEQELFHDRDKKFILYQMMPLEEKWLLPNRTRKELARLYRLLYEQDLTPPDKNPLAPPGMAPPFSKVLRKIYIKILAGHLSRFDLGTLDAEIEALEKSGIPAAKLMTEYKSAFGIVLYHIWTSMPSRLSAKDLSRLDRYAAFIDNPFLGLQVREYVLSRKWPGLSLDQKLDYLFDGSQRGFHWDRFHDFVEHEVRTQVDLDKVFHKLQEKTEAFLTQDPSWKTGALAALLDTAPGADFYHALLLALYQSAKSDAPLKKELYEVLSQRFVVEDSTEDSEIDLPEEMRIEFAERIGKYLLSLDVPARMALLRRLLTGDYGLISKPRKRRKFLKALVNESLEDEKNHGLKNEILRVVEAADEVKHWQPLYFVLQDFLAGRIANPPAEKMSWDALSESLERRKNALSYRRNFWKSEYDLAKSVGDNKTMAEAKKQMAYLEEKLDALTTPYEEYSRKIRKRAARNEILRYPWRQEAVILDYSEEILRTQLKRLGVKTKPYPKAGLSSLQFIVEVAKRGGALPVRFLQLIPQFADLSSEEEKAFAEVFDALYGQSKLTAVKTLEREWPSIWQDIESVEEHIGGGALSTVYKVKRRDRGYDALKVLNPNLIYHLGNNKKMVDEIVQALIQKDPDRYGFVPALLEDIEEWIQRDVSYKGFLEKDKIFREANHGFKPDGFRYSLYVPQSSGPASQYFIREEYIEGKTLKHWNELVQAGHDMKQIAALITKNYLWQLREGKYIHADLTLGNFSVTADHRVAVLDRNLFLELNEPLRKLISLLTNPAGFRNLDPHEFADLILSVSEVKGDPSNAKRGLAHRLEKTLARAAQGDWQSLKDILIETRKLGVRLPLEIRLIIKNLNFLHKLSLRAGFELGIIDAYFATPSGGRDFMGQMAAAFLKQSPDLGKRSELRADGHLTQADLEKYLRREADPIERVRAVAKFVRHPHWTRRTLDERYIQRLAKRAKIPAIWITRDQNLNMLKFDLQQTYLDAADDQLTARLKLTRTYLGLSPEELAEIPEVKKIGLTASKIRDLEKPKSGMRRIPVDYIHALANLVKLPAPHLEHSLMWHWLVANQDLSEKVKVLREALFGPDISSLFQDAKNRGIVIPVQEGQIRAYENKKHRDHTLPSYEYVIALSKLLVTPAEVIDKRMLKDKLLNLKTLEEHLKFARDVLGESQASIGRSLNLPYSESLVGFFETPNAARKHPIPPIYARRLAKKLYIPPAYIDRRFLMQELSALRPLTLPGTKGYSEDAEHNLRQQRLKKTIQFVRMSLTHLEILTGVDSHDIAGYLRDDQRKRVRLNVYSESNYLKFVFKLAGLAGIDPGYLLWGESLPDHLAALVVQESRRETDLTHEKIRAVRWAAGESQTALAKRMTSEDFPISHGMISLLEHPDPKVRVPPSRGYLAKLAHDTGIPPLALDRELLVEELLRTKDPFVAVRLVNQFANGKLKEIVEALDAKNQNTAGLTPLMIEEFTTSAKQSWQLGRPQFEFFAKLVLVDPAYFDRSILEERLDAVPDTELHLRLRMVRKFLRLDRPSLSRILSQGKWALNPNFTASPVHVTPYQIETYESENPKRRRRAKVAYTQALARLANVSEALLPGLRIGRANSLAYEAKIRRQYLRAMAEKLAPLSHAVLSINVGEREALMREIRELLLNYPGNSPLFSTLAYRLNFESGRKFFEILAGQREVMLEGKPGSERLSVSGTITLSFLTAVGSKQAALLVPYSKRSELREGEAWINSAFLVLLGELSSVLEEQNYLLTHASAEGTETNQLTAIKGENAASGRANEEISLSLADQKIYFTSISNFQNVPNVPMFLGEYQLMSFMISPSSMYFSYANRKDPETGFSASLSVDDAVEEIRRDRASNKIYLVLKKPAFTRLQELAAARKHFDAKLGTSVEFDGMPIAFTHHHPDHDHWLNRLDLIWSRTQAVPAAVSSEITRIFYGQDVTFLVQDWRSLLSALMQIGIGERQIVASFNALLQHIFQRKPGNVYRYNTPNRADALAQLMSLLSRTMANYWGVDVHNPFDPMGIPKLFRNFLPGFVANVLRELDEIESTLESDLQVHLADDAEERVAIKERFMRHVAVYRKIADNIQKSLTDSGGRSELRRSGIKFSTPEETLRYLLAHGSKTETFYDQMTSLRRKGRLTGVDKSLRQDDAVFTAFRFAVNTLDKFFKARPQESRSLAALQKWFSGLVPNIHRGVRLPQRSNAEIQSEVLRRALEDRGVQYLLKKGFSWNQISKLIGVVSHTDIGGQTFYRRASALDHISEALARPLSQALLRKYVPALPDSMSAGAILRAFLSPTVVKLKGVSFYEWTQVAAVADASYEPHVGPRLDLMASALDHFFNRTGERYSLAALRRYVPKPSEGPKEAARILAAALANGKPDGLTWNQYLRLFPVAYSEYEGVPYEDLERMASRIDHLPYHSRSQDSPRALTYLQHFADARNLPNGTKGLRELFTEYLHTLANRPATIEELTAYLITEAYNGRLPKSHGAPHRYDAKGNDLFGMKASSLMTYLPTLAYRLFMPWIQRWNDTGRLPPVSPGASRSEMRNPAYRISLRMERASYGYKFFVQDHEFQVVTKKSPDGKSSAPFTIRPVSGESSGLLADTPFLKHLFQTVRDLTEAGTSNVTANMTYTADYVTAQIAPYPTYAQHIEPASPGTFQIRVLPANAQTVTLKIPDHQIRFLPVPRDNHLLAAFRILIMLPVILSEKEGSPLYQQVAKLVPGGKATGYDLEDFVRRVAAQPRSELRQEARTRAVPGASAPGRSEVRTAPPQEPGTVIEGNPREIISQSIQQGNFRLELIDANERKKGRRAFDILYREYQAEARRRNESEPGELEELKRNAREFVTGFPQRFDTIKQASAVEMLRESLSQETETKIRHWWDRDARDLDFYMDRLDEFKDRVSAKELEDFIDAALAAYFWSMDAASLMENQEGSVIRRAEPEPSEKWKYPNEETMDRVVNEFKELYSLESFFAQYFLGGLSNTQHPKVAAVLKRLAASSKGSHYGRGYIFALLVQHFYDEEVQELLEKEAAKDAGENDNKLLPALLDLLNYLDRPRAKEFLIHYATRYPALTDDLWGYFVRELPFREIPEKMRQTIFYVAETEDADLRELAAFGIKHPNLLEVFRDRMREYRDVLVQREKGIYPFSFKAHDFTLRPIKTQQEYELLRSQNADPLLIGGPWDSGIFVLTDNQTQKPVAGASISLQQRKDASVYKIDRLNVFGVQGTDRRRQALEILIAGILEFVKLDSDGAPSRELSWRVALQSIFVQTESPEFAGFPLANFIVPLRSELRNNERELTGSELFQKFDEFLGRKFSTTQDSSKGTFFNGAGTMNWHDSSPAQIHRMPENGMTAALPHKDEASFLKRTDNTVSWDLGKVGHQAAISVMEMSRLSRAFLSSASDQRYNLRAFLILASASLFVSPWLVHPGRLGIYTLNPLLGSRSNTTLYFISFSLLLKILSGSIYNTSPAGRQTAFSDTLSSRSELPLTPSESGTAPGGRPFDVRSELRSSWEELTDKLRSAGYSVGHGNLRYTQLIQPAEIHYRPQEAYSALVRWIGAPSQDRPGDLHALIAWLKFALQDLKEDADTSRLLATSVSEADYKKFRDIIIRWNSLAAANKRTSALPPLTAVSEPVIPKTKSPYVWVTTDNAYQFRHPNFPGWFFQVTTYEGFDRTNKFNRFRITTANQKNSLGIEQIIDGHNQSRSFHEVLDDFDGKTSGILVLRTDSYSIPNPDFKGVVTGVKLGLLKGGNSSSAFIRIHNRNLSVAPPEYAGQNADVFFEGSWPVELRIGKKRFALILKRNKSGQIIDVAREGFYDVLGDFTGQILRFQADAKYGRASFGAPLTGIQVAVPTEKPRWMSAAFQNGVLLRTDEWNKIPPVAVYDFTSGYGTFALPPVKAPLHPARSHTFITLRDFSGTPITSHKLRIPKEIYRAHSGAITGLSSDQRARVRLPDYEYQLPVQWHNRPVIVLRFLEEKRLIVLVQGNRTAKAQAAFIFPFQGRRQEFLPQQMKEEEDLRKKYAYGLKFSLSPSSHGAVPMARSETRSNSGKPGTLKSGDEALEFFTVAALAEMSLAPNAGSEGTGDSLEVKKNFSPEISAATATWSLVAMAREAMAKKDYGLAKKLAKRAIRLGREPGPEEMPVRGILSARRLISQLNSRRENTRSEMRHHEAERGYSETRMWPSRNKMMRPRKSVGFNAESSLRKASTTTSAWGGWIWILTILNSLGERRVVRSFTGTSSSIRNFIAGATGIFRKERILDFLRIPRQIGAPLEHAQRSDWDNTQGPLFVRTERLLPAIQEQDRREFASPESKAFRAEWQDPLKYIAAKMGSWVSPSADEREVNTSLLERQDGSFSPSANHTLRSEIRTIPNRWREDLDNIRKQWQSVDAEFGDFLTDQLEYSILGAQLIGLDLENLELTGAANPPSFPLLSKMPDHHLEQILANHFTNALHAMAERNVKKLTVDVGQDGESDFIRITDTGHGIEPRDLDKIWDPFFTKKPAGIIGTGFGLAIVKSIILEHGAKVEIESAVGKGTTFTIRFPALTSHNESRSEMRSKQPVLQPEKDFLDLLKSEFPDKRGLTFLDVGTGEGDFLLQMKSIFKADGHFQPKFFALDPSEDTKANTGRMERAGITVVNQELAVSPTVHQLKPQSFDVITINAPDFLMKPEYQSLLLTPGKLRDGLELMMLPLTTLLEKYLAPEGVLMVRIGIDPAQLQQHLMLTWLKSYASYPFHEFTNHLTRFPAGSATYASLFPPVAIRKWGTKFHHPPLNVRPSSPFLRSELRIAVTVASIYRSMIFAKDFVARINNKALLRSIVEKEGRRLGIIPEEIHSTIRFSSNVVEFLKQAPELRRWIASAKTTEEAVRLLGYSPHPNPLPQGEGRVREDFDAADLGIKSLYLAANPKAEYVHFLVSKNPEKAVAAFDKNLRALKDQLGFDPSTLANLHVVAARSESELLRVMNQHFSQTSSPTAVIAEEKVVRRVGIHPNLARVLLRNSNHQTALFKIMAERLRNEVANRLAVYEERDILNGAQSAELLLEIQLFHQKVIASAA